MLQSESLRARRSSLAALVDFEAIVITISSLFNRAEKRRVKGEVRLPSSRLMNYHQIVLEVKGVKSKS